MTQTWQHVELARRPAGGVVADDFAFASEPMPTLSDGFALVENLYLSVDPYMRGLMNETWDLHAPLEGRSVGRVVESAAAALSPGDLVFHWKGWRTHAVVSPDEVRRLPDVPGLALTAFLGVLGGTGLTAYAGLTRTARLQPGETVLISSAAGGVGSAAGQLARVLGAGKVIGTVGSDAKAAHLVDDLGFDASVNYRSGPLDKSLAEVVPDGVDVYFDNVGGSHLQAAISVMKQYGRIACCGAISQYNGASQPGPMNLYGIVEKTLRVEGFSVREHLHLQDELQDLAIPHLLDGTIRSDDTVYDSFDQIAEAFVAMFAGSNVGKTLVRVS